MPKKIHLDSVNRPNGIVWFTLVFEDERQFFVEKIFDSNLPFKNNEYEKIDPKDFSKHFVNGTSLTHLVAKTLDDFPRP